MEAGEEVEVKVRNEGDLFGVDFGSTPRCCFRRLVDPWAFWES